ncbi:hypothetical protein BDV18DRAFT_158438 [Aspergillus unguis]
MPTTPTRTNTFTTPKPKKPTTLTRLLHYVVFIFLSIILLCLIVLTPADAIYQCYITSRLTNIFIITGGYVVTFLLAVLIYATRIYTNRTVLRGIPKAWIPVEKEDVGKSVRRLVVEGLGRSALIAGGARPRPLFNTGMNGRRRTQLQTHTQTPAQAHALADVGEDGGVGEEQEGLLRGFDFDVDPANPPWGFIEHPGWSAPESALSVSAQSDGAAAHSPPSLCYRNVIRELPHLIEAKAVSLAPPDPVHTLAPPSQHPNQGQEDEALRIPDTRIVAILRRASTTSLRGYINHLNSMSIINPPETGLEFLSLYEHARFSGRDLYEDEFRALMGVFADVLRGMRFDFEAQRQLLDLELDTDIGSDAYTFESRSESVIGPSDEEGETETDTLGSGAARSPSFTFRSGPAYGYGSDQGHHRSTRGSVPASNSDGATATAAAGTRSSLGQSAQTWQTQLPLAPPRTPSASSRSSRSRSRLGPRPLQPVRSRSNGSGSPNGARSFSSASRSGSSVYGHGHGYGSGSGSASGGSVIRLADARTESVTGLPYVLGDGPAPGS